MFETDDQVQEYERTRSSIDLQAALVFAQHRHTTIGLPATRLSHFSTVGELTDLYLTDLYFETKDFIAARYMKTVCKAAAYLHEVIQFGKSFEDVVKITDDFVAGLVAQITPDPRLPFPKRIRLFGNQIGLASAEAQVIKLADMRHTVKMLSESPADKQECSDFLDECKQVIPCLHKLTDPLLVKRINSLKKALKIFSKTVEG